MISRYLYRAGHLYDTGVFKTLPAERQVRPGKYTNQPKAPSPHLAADEAKANARPVRDPQPTKAVKPPSPRPYVPTPTITIEPAMSARDARFMQRLCVAGIVVVVAVAVAALALRTFGVPW
jgi:hypothetical protein